VLIAQQYADRPTSAQKRQHRAKMIRSGATGCGWNRTCTDLSLVTQDQLDQPAQSLNTPSETLGWMAPPDKLAEALQ